LHYNRARFNSDGHGVSNLLAASGFAGTEVQLLKGGQKLETNRRKQREDMGD